MTAVARRPRLVQPPPMGKVKVPWLVIRENDDGSKRYYFMPHYRDRPQGWTALRLHDQYQRPIADPLRAAEACNALADIYRRWRQGEEGYGPWRIDKLGRIVDQPARKIRKGKNFKPGQIGAMVHDFMAHEIFQSLGDKTRAEYKIYLDLFVERFGDTDWRRLSPGEARAWLVERADAGGPSGAHALYRTVRAFFGKVRLVYTDIDHPGIVPQEQNPFLSLNLSLPRAAMILWPREAVEAFVALADEKGQPSIGDAIVQMSWLGIRKQDWLDWPKNVFDGELLAFTQDKTDKPLVIPWQVVPALVHRVAEAKRRRTADAIFAPTFYHDAQGRPWGKPARFREAFNALRDELEKRQPWFDTRYYVGLDADHPLRLPTGLLTMRTMRHTCVTLLHDAGIPRDLMPAITGHEPKSIDEVLAYYHARTADQAALALGMRVAHEAKGAKA